MIFLVIIEKAEDGWYVIECPALPGCISQGKSEEEALINIKEAINAWLWAESKKNVKNIDGDNVIIINDSSESLDDDIHEELDLDWSNAKPNPYAKKLQAQRKLFIQLDPDVAKFFKSSNQVNEYLRKHLQIHN